MAKLKNPLLVYIGFAIFFIAGVFMLFMGFKSLFGGIGYAKTTGTVISVRTYNDDEGNLLGVPTYEYEVDGVTYQHERSYAQSIELCPLVGDTVTVRYNKNDPSKIKDDSIITVMFFIFGVVFAGVGGSMFTLTAIGKIHWERSRRTYGYSSRRRNRKFDSDDESENISVETSAYDEKTDPFE